MKLSVVKRASLPLDYMLGLGCCQNGAAGHGLGTPIF